MRFFIAAVLYLAALTMIVVGFAERTIWAPAPSNEYAILLDSNSPYVLIDHATLTRHDGAPEIKFQGGISNNVAIVARESDLIGWLENMPETRIVFDKAGKKLKSVDVSGVIEKLDPTKSDMWRTVVTDPNQVSFSVDTSDEGALLITSDGQHASPNSISLVWQVPFDHTPSNLLITSGLGLLAAGVVMNILAYYSMRKKRGPRRRTPRAPQGPRYRPSRKSKKALSNNRGRRAARKMAFSASGLILVTALSGCSPVSSEPTPSSSATSLVQTDPAVVDAAQISKIVSDVVSVAATADEIRSADLLTSRFAGPALTQRTAHYKLQSKSTSIENLPAIANDVISFTLPAASRIWPRTVMAVTASSDSKQLPQVLVLQQDSPRSNYKVWYDIAVLPGIAFPEVPTVDGGAIPVAPDSLFLKVQPNQLASAYGDLIDSGSSSAFASLFDLTDDVFYQQVSQSQKDTIAKLTKAKVTVTHDLANSNVIGLSTVDSGAIIALQINDVYTIKPTKKSAVTVSGNEKLLFGASGSAKGIKTTYADILLFYVPASSSKDSIRTLGASQYLLSVKGL